MTRTRSYAITAKSRPHGEVDEMYAQAFPAEHALVLEAQEKVRLTKASPHAIPTPLWSFKVVTQQYCQASLDREAAILEEEKQLCQSLPEGEAKRVAQEALLHQKALVQTQRLHYESKLKIANALAGEPDPSEESLHHRCMAVTLPLNCR